jgi:hypothetical protein
MRTVAARIFSVAPDRTEYKQYNARLMLRNVYVAVEIPDNMIRSDLSSENKTVLTPDGYAYLLGELADAVDAMHEEWIKNKFRRGEK